MSNTCLSCTKNNYCDNAFTDIEDCQVFTSEPIKIPKPKPIVFFSDTEILTRGEILNQRENERPLIKIDGKLYYIASISIEGYFCIEKEELSNGSKS